MALMKNFLSVIGANSIPIVIAGVMAFGVWFGINKISDLSETVTTLSQTVDTQNKTILKMKEEYAENQRTSTIYMNTTNANISNMNSRLSQLDKAAGREKTVAAKPGLVTKVAKKQVSEYQDRLACATGNQDSCLRLQQQSQPAQTKK